MESISQCLLNHPASTDSKADTLTLLILKGRKPKTMKATRKRILAEVEVPMMPVQTGSANESSDNVIYIKPDAIFGILLTLFIFFVTYVGVMCLFNTNTPRSFANKPFKFGREL
jgi:hypothetical protein